jgi:hypothetical protein
MFELLDRGIPSFPNGSVHFLRKHWRMPPDEQPMLAALLRPIFIADPDGAARELVGTPRLASETGGEGRGAAREAERYSKE